MSDKDDMGIQSIRLSAGLCMDPEAYPGLVRMQAYVGPGTEGKPLVLDTTDDPDVYVLKTIDGVPMMEWKMLV